MKLLSILTNYFAYFSFSFLQIENDSLEKQDLIIIQTHIWEVLEACGPQELQFLGSLGRLLGL